jgi:hypothetical protein
MLKQNILRPARESLCFSILFETIVFKCKNITIGTYAVYRPAFFSSIGIFIRLSENTLYPKISTVLYILGVSRIDLLYNRFKDGR